MSAAPWTAGRVVADEPSAVGDWLRRNAALVVVCVSAMTGLGTQWDKWVLSAVEEDLTALRTRAQSAQAEADDCREDLDEHIAEFDKLFPATRLSNVARATDGAPAPDTETPE